MKKFGQFLKRHRKFICIALVLILIAGSIGIGLDQKEKHKWKKHPVEVKTFTFTENGDIEIIRQRMVEAQKNADLDVDPILADLQADGTFKSIDYQSERKDDWPPIYHLKKVLDLQIAYYSEGNAHFKDPVVKAAVTKAMQNWVENGYKCEWNWWYNVVGIGKYIPDILLFGVNDLSPEAQKQLLSGIKASLLQNEKVFYGAASREVDSSGGNLTDQILSTMKVAVFEEDGSTLMWLKSLLERELHPFPSYEPGMFRADCVGIKEDGSFQQHDQLIYFGGYGEVFADGVNKYLKYTNNTQYAINEEAVNLYADFLLDSMQLFTRGGYRDISVSGRGISRRDSLKGIASQTKAGAEVLLTYENVKRADELQKMLDTRFLSEQDAGAAGHRYFYESDTQVINNRNYMATMRTSSIKTRIYEYLNGENPKAYYTGLGATFFYVNGNEYDNLLPVYDWNKIPGTTTRQGFLPVPDENFSYNTYGASKNVNGVSNGTIGMSYMELNDNDVTGKKAYFMFEDAVVCLGTDLQTKQPELLLTNINQTNFAGEAILKATGSDAESSVQLGDFVTGTYDYVYHNGIAYFTSGDLEIEAKHVDGDWKTLNDRATKSFAMSADRFTISIPHKEENASYAYTVLMNTDLEGTQSYAAAPRYTVLQNNSDCQAVYDTKTGTVQVVFHKAGTLDLPNGKMLTVSKPCVLMAVPQENQAEVFIASYDRKDKKVKVSLNGQTKKISTSKKTTSELF